MSSAAAPEDAAEPENPPIAVSIYELLSNQEDARACRDIPESACRTSPTNFVVMLVSYFLTKVGDAVANPKTVLTWVMTSVQAPVWMLGFLVPIRESGSLIPQLMIAAVVRRLEVRKWVWVAGSIVQALALLGMGGVAMTFEGAAAGLGLLGLLTVFSLARGLCSVASKDVLGKTIPKGRRGQLTGWSASAAGLVTVGAGLALLTRAEPESGGRFYGFALIGGATLWILAAALYGRIREFPGETEGGRDAIREAFARLDLLRKDAPFRLFVISRSLLLCSALTAPYLVALGQRHIGSEGRVLGIFVAASGTASLIAAPIWGRLTDRSSRRVMFLSGLLSAAISGAVALTSWLSPGLLSAVWYLPASYFLLTIAHSGVRVGRKTYVVDLAQGNRRTDYVSVSNTVIGVVLLATGLIGSLASVLSIGAVVGILSLMGAAGAVCAGRLPETD